MATEQELLDQIMKVLQEQKNTIDTQNKQIILYEQLVRVLEFKIKNPTIRDYLWNKINT